MKHEMTMMVGSGERGESTPTAAPP